MVPAPVSRADTVYANVIRMPEQVSPFMAFQVLKRRKLLTIVLACSLAAIALLAIYRIRPFYDATASILIETRRNAFSDLQASGEIVNPDVIALRTQADIIQSSELALDVVKSLDLVHEPEYVRLLDPSPSLIVRAKTELLLLLGVPQPPAVPLTPDERVQTVANYLRGQVIVNNVGRSYVLEIRVRTDSAILSAKIANALAASYLAFNRQQKERAIARGTELLEAQIVPLRDRARDTEAAVERYRQANGLVLNNGGGGQVGQGTTLTGQRLYQSISELTAAAGDIAQKEASLAAVESARKSGAGLYSIPEVLASPVVQKLREQEGTLLTREAVQNPVESASNPLTRSSRAEVGAIRAQIDSEVTKIVNGLRNQVAAARSKSDSLKREVQALQSELEGQNQAGVRLKQLENEAEAARSVYRSLLGRYEQISNQVALQGSDASLISMAQPPLSRAGPPRNLYAALGALASLGGSVLLTLVVERLSGGATIRTVSQLETTTGLFPLGMLPKTSHRRQSARQLSRWMASRRTLGVIRESVRRIGPQGRATVVMVTSALPEEGKTWLAMSLATNAQQAGERTLLIDADMRQPSIMRSMRLDPASGHRNGDPADARQLITWHDVLEGLDVAACDPQAHLPSSSPQLDVVARLIRASSLKYDLVVVDTPPLLLFSDAVTMAPFADGVVFAVRWQQTTSAAVREALHTLNMCGAKVIGGVLTLVRPEKLLTSETGSASVYKNYARYLKHSKPE